MKPLKRYEVLTDLLADLIRSGEINPGAKLLSVRQASSHYGVSPSTVFQAYYALENRGLIRARERSGYYVSDNINCLLPEPNITKTNAATTSVNISELVYSVMADMADRDIIPLGSAFPDPGFFPLKKLSQCFYQQGKNMEPQLITDYLGAGSDELRKQLSLRYQTAGVPVNSEEITICNGALEALNLCFQATTRPGDVVAVESPGFYAVLQIVERLGLKAIEVPVHPRDGMDIAALSVIIKKHKIAACCCMSNFQNPTGAAMPAEKKQALVSLLAKHSVPLIEDDVYEELYFSKHRPNPAKTYDEEGLVLHCSSFSKSLAPGYRIGWVAGGRYAESIRRTKLMTTLSASVPSQLAISSYLESESYDRHLRKLRHIFEVRKNHMLAGISEYFPRQTKVSRPNGGYFLWIELPKEIDALTLYRKALQSGISVAPGPIFSAVKRFRNCIRLNYAQDIDLMDRALLELGRLISL